MITNLKIIKPKTVFDPFKTIVIEAYYNDIPIVIKATRLATEKNITKNRRTPWKITSIRPKNKQFQKQWKLISTFQEIKSIDKKLSEKIADAVYDFYTNYIKTNFHKHTNSKWEILTSKEKYKKSFFQDPTQDIKVISAIKIDGIPFTCHFTGTYLEILFSNQTFFFKIDNMDKMVVQINLFKKRIHRNKKYILSSYKIFKTLKREISPNISMKYDFNEQEHIFTINNKYEFTTTPDMFPIIYINQSHTTFNKKEKALYFLSNLNLKSVLDLYSLHPEIDIQITKIKTFPKTEAAGINKAGNKVVLRYDMETDNITISNNFKLRKIDKDILKHRIKQKVIEYYEKSEQFSTLTEKFPQVNWEYGFTPSFDDHGKILTLLGYYKNFKIITLPITPNTSIDKEITPPIVLKQIQTVNNNIEKPHTQKIMQKFQLYQNTNMILQPLDIDTIIIYNSYLNGFYPLFDLSHKNHIEKDIKVSIKDYHSLHINITGYTDINTFKKILQFTKFQQIDQTKEAYFSQDI